MAADFDAILAVLKPVLARYADRLTVTADSPAGYSLDTKSPSPFPQHKGHPMFFGAVRPGKAYVSFHLMPLYMCPELMARVPPALKKRMQGKSCFNFKAAPEPELVQALAELTDEAFRIWSERKWV
jgi:hypothetical protein